MKIKYFLTNVLLVNCCFVSFFCVGASDYGNYNHYEPQEKYLNFREKEDPVSAFETYVPNKTPRLIPFFEYTVLKKYLSDNNNVRLIQTLALYHLGQSVVSNSMLPQNKRNDAEAVRHTVIALYFLNRCIDLGCRDAWVSKNLTNLERALDKFINDQAKNDSSLSNADEDHAAHISFRDSFFNNHEENRYEVVSALLNDFVKHPNNMQTNTYLTTANIWNGGEAAYYDPGILYDFILSSYFSVRARYLAEKVEQLWAQDPINNRRFRLAGNIGGWTVPARRWLARFHGDQAAVDRLDVEHNLWLAINPAFTSVPVGLMLFEESPAKMAEGYAAYDAGSTTCAAHPKDLSCLHWPRVTYNYLPFLLGQIDYLLKFGQLDTARYLLTLRNIPIDEFSGIFPFWDLGRDAWLHREQNLERIVELYQNNDPSDDPSHFLLKQHKWGPGAFICQTCHQRQGKTWAEGSIEKTLAYADEFPAIGHGNWPDVMTSWYGSTKR